MSPVFEQSRLYGVAISRENVPQLFTGITERSGITIIHMAELII